MAEPEPLRLFNLEVSKNGITSVYYVDRHHRIGPLIEVGTLKPYRWETLPHEAVYGRPIEILPATREQHRWAKAEFDKMVKLLRAERYSQNNTMKGTT
jgi:hypothetical protein